jgi:hypothetical protein
MLTVPERESGGTVALERFDYQTAWGASRAMRLHRDGANYALAFEFHDDIVELDSADARTAVRFYQIKTKKSGSWTLKKIHKQGLSKELPRSSFAARMFENVKRFGSLVEKLVFVSNQPCSELGADYKEYSFLSADKPKIDNFVSSMKLEHESFSVNDAKLFYYLYSELSLGSFDNALMGEVSDFIRKQLGLEEGNARAFGLALLSECRMRSKQLAEVKDFDALKRSKFVTRSDMDSWLAVFKDQHARRADWSSVAPYIPDYGTARALKIEWEKYDSERRRRLCSGSLKFQSDVLQIAEKHISKAATLLLGIEAALPEVKQIIAQWLPGASDQYIRAVILYEHWHAK